MSFSNYDELFKNLLQISGNELSKFELYALLIHAVFLRNQFESKEKKILDAEWNKEFNKAVFDYSYKLNNKELKISVLLTKDIENSEKILISINGSWINSNGSVKITSSIDLNHEMCTKIDFDNLNESILLLEKFIKDILIKEIARSGENNNQNNNQNNNNQNNNQSNPIDSRNYPFRYGQEIDPNDLLNRNINQGGYNPLPNPFFSTGGGSVGGNLVGPTSDIFIGNMNPRPMPGIHPTIRYDPIGPFGTHGAPQRPDPRRTDPFTGGDPFGGDPFIEPFGNINKKPSGGNPFGGNPFGGFGGGMGGNPWG
jgi:hypothetical protein